ncbi:helix-turn-helix domain-containing protein [Pseudoclavibacter sp. RFBJ3]
MQPLGVRWYHSSGGVVWESVRSLLEAAVQYPSSANPHSANALRSLFRAAAQALVVEATPTAQLREPDTLELVKLIVENRYQVVGFAVDDIARETGLSRRVLERRLHAVGTSPAMILRARRAERARSLTQEYPHMPTGEVAQRSGFSSPTTMRRALQGEL